MGKMGTEKDSVAKQLATEGGDQLKKAQENSRLLSFTVSNTTPL